MKRNRAGTKKQIVVLGGGFAGVRAVLDLDNYLRDHDDYEITLVDRRDYQCFYAGLYEAATTEHKSVRAAKVKRAVTIPFENILKGSKVNFLKAYINRIELANKKVFTDSKVLDFDYLVVAMGSVPDYANIPGVEKYGFSLKSLEEAIMIRNRVEDIVTKKESGRIVIAGGGYAGTEFAGELYNLVKIECKRLNKDASKFKILIVDGTTTFLPGLPENVIALVSKRIQELGIETKFSTLVTEAGANYLVLNMKDRIDCDLLVWTAGVKSCKLPFDEEFSQDKKDRTIVSEYLNLQKFPNVFLAGDNQCSINSATKRTAGQTSVEAIRQGKVVAKNIFRLIECQKLLPYSVSSSRLIIPMSGKYAIYYTPNLVIAGFTGWVFRKFADLKYFFSILPIFKALRLWVFENKIFIKND